MRGVLVLAVLTATTSLSAHPLGTSYLDLRRDGNQAALLFDFDPDGLTTTPAYDDDASGSVESPELRRHASALAALVAQTFLLRSGDAPCVVAAPSAHVSDAAHLLRVGLAYTCENQGPLELEWVGADRFTRGHHVLVSSRLGEAPAALVLDEEHSTWREDGHTAVPGHFFRLGLEHIATGVDHLLFLLALIIVRTTLRELAWVVTSFTIAHSLTLAATAVGTVAPPAVLIEPAIALSIGYVGAENLWRPRTRWRGVLAFAFGLLHGLGFGGALVEMGLPTKGRMLALVSFNLGVEAGQIAIALFALPLLRFLQRTSPAGASRFISAGLAGTGAVWFVVRVLT